VIPPSDYENFFAIITPIASKVTPLYNEAASLGGKPTVCASLPVLLVPRRSKQRKTAMSVRRGRKPVLHTDYNYL
jgi:hypothetical protein